MVTKHSPSRPFGLPLALESAIFSRKFFRAAKNFFRGGVRMKSRKAIRAVPRQTHLEHSTGCRQKTKKSVKNSVFHSIYRTFRNSLNIGTVMTGFNNICVQRDEIVAPPIFLAKNPDKRAGFVFARGMYFAKKSYRPAQRSRSSVTKG
jgi:hypothetical protein